MTDGDYNKQLADNAKRTLERLASLEGENNRTDMALATSVTMAEEYAGTSGTGDFDWTKVPFSWERSRPEAFDAKREESLYLAEIHTRNLKDSLTQAALFAADGENQNIWRAQQWIRMAAISAGILENTLADQFKAKIDQERANGE